MSWSRLLLKVVTLVAVNVMIYDGNVIGVDLIFPFSLLISNFFCTESVCYLVIQNSLCGEVD